jgi:uncharacterized protein (TIGR03000 family)
VPKDAIVLINGRRTAKTGIHRDFMSVGLTDGFSYKYVVCAQLSRDGRIFEDAREVILRATDRKHVTFSLVGVGGAELTSAR